MGAILHHFETTGSHCLLVFCRGIIPGFLRWSRISSIRSMGIMSSNPSKTRRLANDNSESGDRPAVPLAVKSRDETSSSTEMGRNVASAFLVAPLCHHSTRGTSKNPLELGDTPTLEFGTRFLMVFGECAPIIGVDSPFIATNITFKR